MSSINDYALKGYFEQLRDEVNRQAGRINKKEFDEVLNLLEKAVGFLEEVYEKDKNMLTADHATDYREMINTLNQNGFDYPGNKEIIALSEAETNIEQPVQKKPMQKAKGKKKEEERRRKYGS